MATYNEKPYNDIYIDNKSSHDICNGCEYYHIGDEIEITGVDLLKDLDDYTVIAEIKPKVKFKNELLRKIAIRAIRLFVYKIAYKTVKGKRIDINCKDESMQDWDGTFTFTYGNEGEIKT